MLKCPTQTIFSSLRHGSVRIRARPSIVFIWRKVNSVTIEGLEGKNFTDVFVSFEKNARVKRLGTLFLGCIYFKSEKI